jgi:hypothetical protein
MPRKGKAKSYVKSVKHRSKAEVRELLEAEERKAKRPRAAASIASLKEDPSSEEEDDEQGYAIPGAPTMHKEDDEMNTAVTSYEAEKIRRMAICYFFVTVYKCPSMEEWDGPNGYVKKITTSMLLPTSARKNVKKTMSDIVCCIAKNKPFTGERDLSKREPDVSP